jgi:hypothetical protein
LDLDSMGKVNRRRVSKPASTVSITEFVLLMATDSTGVDS